MPRIWSFVLKEPERYFNKKPEERICQKCDVKGCISHLDLDTLANIRISSMKRTLTDDQVREARKRFADGESIKSIAKDLNYRYEATCAVVHGQRYKDVK